MKKYLIRTTTRLDGGGAGAAEVAATAAATTTGGVGHDDKGHNPKHDDKGRSPDNDDNEHSPIDDDGKGRNSNDDDKQRNYKQRNPDNERNPIDDDENIHIMHDDNSEHHANDDENKHNPDSELGHSELGPIDDDDSEHNPDDVLEYCDLRDGDSEEADDDGASDYGGGGTDCEMDDDDGAAAILLTRIAEHKVPLVQPEKKKEFEFQVGPMNFDEVIKAKTAERQQFRQLVFDFLAFSEIGNYANWKLNTSFVTEDKNCISFLYECRACRRREDSTKIQGKCTVRYERSQRRATVTFRAMCSPQHSKDDVKSWQIRGPTRKGMDVFFFVFFLFYKCNSKYTFEYANPSFFSFYYYYY